MYNRKEDAPYYKAAQEPLSSREPSKIRGLCKGISVLQERGRAEVDGSGGKAGEQQFRRREEGAGRGKGEQRIP